MSARCVRAGLLDRRTLLKLGLAGGGVIAAHSLAGLSQRPAIAAEPARARRILIVNLSGGIRSSAAFHAAPDNAADALQHNPWGTIQGGAAGNLSLGQLLDDHVRTGAPAGAAIAPTGVPTAPQGDAAYRTDPAGGWKGELLPRFRDAANYAVVGTWHEMRGDHVRSSFEEATGFPDGGRPGILTRALAGLDAKGQAAVPGFHVSPFAYFGNAAGAVVRHAPVSLASPYALPGEAVLDATELAAIGHDWARDEDMRDRLDSTRLEGRAGFARQLIEGFTAHRRTNRVIGARLAEPWVHVETGAAEASYGAVSLAGGEVPLTNAMLYELAQLVAPTGGYGMSYFEDALNWMLAVRLLQLGSPAVAIETAGFDLHSGEATEAPLLYSTLGRLWATLGWLLARIPEADGEGSMLDHTLVVTMSDFGRDRGKVAGFNGGEGSDHGVDASCFYLAHAVMGAGVVPDRILGAAPVETFDPRGQAELFTPHHLLATLLAALGLDHEAPVWGFDDITSVIPLWS